MILPKERDPRFITIRRGGTLTDADHYLLALWAATCAEHVLPLFERANPNDKRPRQALALTRAWVNGEIPMKVAHQAAFATNAAAKGLPDAAKFAALAAGQAVAVAHVAAHELGAAAYAIRAVRASVAENEQDEMGRKECEWQRNQLPDAIRELVLDDQKLRNHLCWFVFDC
ncbi:MAG: putative immunity protein [Adhaeribacter sp.]